MFGALLFLWLHTAPARFVPRGKKKGGWMDGNAKRGENTDHKALNLCVRTFFHSRFNASQKFCFYYDAMDRFELSKQPNFKALFRLFIYSLVGRESASKPTLDAVSLKSLFALWLWRMIKSVKRSELIFT
jgi:hypothetical protein